MHQNIFTSKYPPSRLVILQNRERKAHVGYIKIQLETIDITTSRWGMI